MSTTVQGYASCAGTPCPLLIYQLNLAAIRAFCLATRASGSAALIRAARCRLRRSRLSVNGRFGRAEEIAEAVLWLSSDLSTYSYGHVLAVDGGYLSR